MSAAMAGSPARHPNLSDMEIKIAKMIAQGFYNKDIARDLEISYGYARNLVSDVCRKLGVTQRTDMAGKLERL
jgi:DNA-binding CsgD family transcriptional regulator